MWTQRILLSLLLVFSTMSAQAFERLFPPIAKRGKLSAANYPVVTVDGKVRQLTMGAWIRNESNTIDMPGSLGNREYVVNYTENAQGEIDRVWILSADEARETPPNKKPENQWANQPQ